MNAVLSGKGVIYLKKNVKWTRKIVRSLQGEYERYVDLEDCVDPCNLIINFYRPIMWIFLVELGENPMTTRRRSRPCVCRSFICGISGSSVTRGCRRREGGRDGRYRT